MVTKQVRAWLKLRRADDDWVPAFEPLAALAESLAAMIDTGDFAAPVARELRATLNDLRKVDGDGDAFDRLAAQLSTAMGDGTN
jgi:hypothetical protein